MKKQISSKIVSLIFAILVICFAIAFYVVAWEEPGSAPPGDNVSAPINVSGTSQDKSGALRIGGVFRTDSETVLAVLGGNVGIGTTNPTAKLHIGGTAGTDGIKFPDGTLQTTAAAADGGGFGAWVSKSNNTVYQAATDGFVMAYGYGDSTIYGYTDSSSSPTTLRIKDGQVSAAGWGNYGITMPVRKNDYWKVTGASTVNWLPVGG